MCYDTLKKEFMYCYVLKPRLVLFSRYFLICVTFFCHCHVNKLVMVAVVWPICFCFRQQYISLEVEQNSFSGTIWFYIKASIKCVPAFLPAWCPTAFIYFSFYIACLGQTIPATGPNNSSGGRSQGLNSICLLLFVAEE